MNTLISRLLANTPPFFKKIQIAIVSVLLVATPLQGLIPPHIFNLALIVGITAIIVCAFAVDDIAILAKNGLSVESLVQVLSNVPGQLAEIKQSVAGKVSLSDAQAIENAEPAAAPAKAAEAADAPASEPAAGK